MFVLQINFGQGWEPTCYRPMDSFSAQRLADRLGAAYSHYSYRVVKA